MIGGICIKKSCIIVLCFLLLTVPLLIGIPSPYIVLLSITTVPMYVLAYLHSSSTITACIAYVKRSNPKLPWNEEVVTGKGP